MSKRYIVRTIYLANFYRPSAELTQQRRKDDPSPEALVGAMRRTEIANQALEDELNAFAEKGYELHSVLHHPQGREGAFDLLITGIFSTDAPPDDADETNDSGAL
ncbi:hypothetical protein G4Y79_18180 [Phototrophicus methaneseepsis]|uniref:DUF4177 domain-containing protein n=1 Tax=Phototrophicus methaneseepsis TaxID=2710758 RepID=A0A7S8E748_9CHLR|nr:hypothetical protein [Phototrophicus methaneseepsis]QPC81603.1 hypothetical protein G4Y79_18180 [Phototrophicus methaneseepsis]